ncbi:MAG: ankyrin repeat domain-containing protein [Acidobacteriota bacterium]
MVRFSDGVVLALVWVLALGCLSCASKVEIKNDRAAINKIEPKPGTFCQKRLYESRSDDPRCYALQEKLHDASVQGNLSEIKEALGDGANVDGTFYDSSPPLIVAARSGQADAVMLLVNNGADVNQVLTFGNTPLKSAVYSKSEPTVRFLIEHGANVCENTPDEDTALEIARKSDSKGILEILNKAGAERCERSTIPKKDR